MTPKYAKSEKIVVNGKKALTVSNIIMSHSFTNLL